LKVAVTVAAFQSAVRPHERKSGPVVIEARDLPGRRAVTFEAIMTERAPMKILMAARAVPVRGEEFLILMTLETGDVLVQGKQVFLLMPELDGCKGQPGRMTHFAFFSEAAFMGRLVAAPAIRTRLAFAVACVARKARVVSEQRKAGFRMLGSEGGGGCIGRSGLDRRRELCRLGMARIEKKNQRREDGHNRNDYAQKPVLI